MTTIAPPPTSQPPVMSSGRRTGIRFGLVTVAVVLAACSVVALAVLAFGLSTFRVITDSQKLTPGVRSLTVDSGDVPVIVRVTGDTTGSEPRVDLRMLTSSRENTRRLIVANDAGGSRVTLGTSGVSYLPWSRLAEITVVLPPGIARGISVTVHQQTGLLFTDADLDQLTAAVDSGALTLGGSARRVDVRVTDGDISTRNPVAVTESLRANTNNGDITLAFRSAPRTVEATSNNGDIELTVPGPGPYRVLARSEGRHGDTTVTVPQSSDAGAPAVTARSNNGDVKVTELR
jgi:hypothetical protein